MTRYLSFSIAVLLLALAVPGWGQWAEESDGIPDVSSSQNQGTWPGEYGLDVWHKIQPANLSSSVPKICRNVFAVSFNNQYYTVVQRATTRLQVYKNNGDPTLNDWTLVKEIVSPNPVRYADIEVSGTNIEDAFCHVIYVEVNPSGNTVRDYRFKVLPPDTASASDVYGPSPSGITLDQTSITSKAMETPPDPMLFACWREYNPATTQYTIRYKRSLDGGNTWADTMNSATVLPTLTMPSDNAITFCPGNDLVYIVYTDSSAGDVYVLKSAANGTNDWTSQQIINYSYPVMAKGITSSYLNYILVTAEVNEGTTGCDILYKYTQSDGTTWLPGALTAYRHAWTGTQKWPSCSSNDDGMFSMLYYNNCNGNTGTAMPPHMEAMRNKFDLLGTTSNWNWGCVDVDHNVNLGEPNACIEDGPPTWWGRPGGVYHTYNSSLDCSSYFGLWDCFAASPPILVHG